MLGNNILKFFRPVFEGKVEKCKWKIFGYCRSINFGCKGIYVIYKRHPNGKICFIRVGHFPDRLKTATLKSMYEKGDKENTHSYLAVLF